MQSVILKFTLISTIKQTGNGACEVVNKKVTCKNIVNGSLWQCDLSEFSHVLYIVPCVICQPDLCHCKQASPNLLFLCSDIFTNYPLELCSLFI